MFVQAFSGDGKVGLTGPRVRVSNGGTNPLWSADGKELYYYRLATRMVMAVTLEYAPRLRTGPPRELFAADLTRSLTHKDTLNDGSRFLLIRPLPAKPIPARMTVMTNWQARARQAYAAALAQDELHPLQA